MQKKIRMVIIILTVLLVASILGLLGTLLYRSSDSVVPTTVIVRDNLITPELESKEQLPASEIFKSSPSGIFESSLSAENVGSSASGTVESSGSDMVDSVQPAAAQTETTADVLSLHKWNTGDNIPFSVSNMFPGDRKTRYYCVRVSHKDDVIVHFHADIRRGYEKLAEVLKCKVVLITAGETLYDGLMKDMPETLSHTLSANTSTISELYYEITTYLETSVGNEYQNKNLIADFCWQAEGSDALVSPPTGDYLNLLLYVCVIVGAFAVLFILVRRKRREVGMNG